MNTKRFCRVFYSPKIAEFTVGTMVKAPNTFQIIPYFTCNIIYVDPDDNKFVDCAFNAGADYIVTNDKHFDVLKSNAFPPIKVIDIDAFKRLISMGRWD